MRRVFTIIFLLGYWKICVALNDSLWLKPEPNSIQIDFGFAHTRLIDEGFTQGKLLFRGTNPKIGLGYVRQSTEAIFNFRLAISLGDINTRQNEWGASFATISSSIEYLRRLHTLKILGRESQLFAGLQLSTKNFALQNDPIFDNVDILSLHGIYFKLNYRVILSDKQNLQFIWSMPMVIYGNQVLWNSGASVYDFNDLDNIAKLVTTHGRFHYFGILNDIPIELVYTIKMGRRVDFNAMYGISYLNYSIDRPIRLYSNDLQLGLNVNF